MMGMLSYPLTEIRSFIFHVFVLLQSNYNNLFWHLCSTTCSIQPLLLFHFCISLSFSSTQPLQFLAWNSWQFICSGTSLQENEFARWETLFPNTRSVLKVLHLNNEALVLCVQWLIDKTNNSNEKREYSRRHIVI